MTTLKDIAEACGVSVSTVSRALNGNSLIRPEVTAAIRERARDMGYRPNEAARTLKTNRSWMIGILYDTSMNHPFFSGVLEEIRKSAENRGYDMVILSRKQREDYADSFDLALARRMDGVIVVYADVADEGLDRLMKNQIPVVSIDDCNRPCPMVVSDYENGTCQMTEEAIARGRRRIAFLHGEMGYPTERRILGYRSALEAHGLREELIPAGFYREERCVELMTQRLKEPDPPDCFLFPDDYAALTAMRRLRAEGVDVPGKIGIAGFDGQPWTLRYSPVLSTFRQDLEGIGEAAVETLLDTRDDGNGRMRSETVIPGTLQAGETL